MKKLIKLFDSLTQSVIVLATFGIMAVTCLQIFCRFILNDALSWPEEAARFMMLWALFLSAGYALHKREHIGLNFFVERLPVRLKAGLDILLHIIVIGFLGVILIGGWQETMTLMPLKTGALRISRAVPYMIIPLSALMYIFVSIGLLIEDIKKLRAK